MVREEKQIFCFRHVNKIKMQAGRSHYAAWDTVTATDSALYIYSRWFQQIRFSVLFLIPTTKWFDWYWTKKKKKKTTEAWTTNIPLKQSCSIYNERCWKKDTELAAIVQHKKYCHSEKSCTKMLKVAPSKCTWPSKSVHVAAGRGGDHLPF